MWKGNGGRGGVKHPKPPMSTPLLLYYIQDQYYLSIYLYYPLFPGNPLV